MHGILNTHDSSREDSVTTHAPNHETSQYEMIVTASNDHRTPNIWGIDTRQRWDIITHKNNNIRWMKWWKLHKLDTTRKTSDCCYEMGWKHTTIVSLLEAAICLLLNVWWVGELVINLKCQTKTIATSVKRKQSKRRTKGSQTINDWIVLVSSVRLSQS